MKRILVVNVNWLGDAILTTPVFKAIKEKFPVSHVGVLCPERVKEVFENNPYVDEIIIFDEKKGHKSIFKKIKFIFELRKKRFQTVFLIHRSFTKALICLLAGIPERVGYLRLKNIGVINKSVPPPTWDIHRQDYYFSLFEKSGINIQDRIPKIYTSEDRNQQHEDLIAQARGKYKYLVGINPSANWLLKRWPQEMFALLCDKLVKELNCGIFFIGAKKDSGTVNAVTLKMEKTHYNLCGETNVKELAHLIKHMDLFISNDSGPAHLSASLGVPTLVFFGPTSSKLTSPKGKIVKILEKPHECEIPCYKLDCIDNVCMKNISIDDAFLEAKLLLENV
ncbi:MAG: lipopolysaccharide heptosyltransferase II [Candidatus Omnitrophota bacterium]